MKRRLFSGRAPARYGVALLAAGLLALAGCGGSDNGDTPGGEIPGTSSPTITIKGFAFTGGLTVAPGATVTVRNEDPDAHTLTATDGSFDTGSIAGGSSGSFTAPGTPGSHEIVCSFHANMSGTLVVAASPAPSGTGDAPSGVGNGY